jgi:hypothetical protein
LINRTHLIKKNNKRKKLFKGYQMIVSLVLNLTRRSALHHKEDIRGGCNNFRKVIKFHKTKKAHMNNSNKTEEIIKNKFWEIDTDRLLLTRIYAQIVFKIAHHWRQPHFLSEEQVARYNWRLTHLETTLIPENLANHDTKRIYWSLLPQCSCSITKINTQSGLVVYHLI